MAKKLLKKDTSIFEEIRHIADNGAEYWTAREMAKALEYAEYRNILPVIEKAKEACRNSGHEVDAHFVDATVSFTLGNNASRIGEDVLLSRYACYLIIQNADPSKEVVANGQTYFAVQTRIAEIQQMAEYNALRTEDEKRVFLREELRQHNAQLAMRNASPSPAKRRMRKSATATCLVKLGRHTTAQGIWTTSL